VVGVKIAPIWEALANAPYVTSSQKEALQQALEAYVIGAARSEVAVTAMATECEALTMSPSAEMASVPFKNSAPFVALSISALSYL